MNSKSIISLLTVLVLALLFGCSSGANQPFLHPWDDNPTLIGDESGKQILGSWTANFNLENKSVEIMPNREMNMHFNVTGYIPAPILNIISWDSATEILTLDVTIRNTTTVDVYEVRLIIFTDSVGHMLVDADEWTGLFDIPGGYAINPFKAYAKSATNRKFGHGTQYTEQCKIKLPGFNTLVRFLIEASYPSNCKEPYMISNFTQGTLRSTINSSAFASVDVYDWQNNISEVRLICNPIFGASYVTLANSGGNNFRGTMINNMGASAGTYIGQITTFSSDEPTIPLYDFVQITVVDGTNSFQIEVTTTSSPQDFICRFVNPGTLHVDWGDNSSNDYNATANVTHTYATAGVYTVSMSGYVNGIDFFIYPDPGTGTPKLISKILTPIQGITGLNSASEMFKHCENITTIPTGLFDQCPGITRFDDTFLACRKLTSIPPGLFKAQTNVTNFYATFDNCDLITEIPPGLFDNHPNNLYFAWLFAKCYNLQSIPEGLFDHNTKNKSFNHTFFRCYNIKSIPPNLFVHNTEVTDFSYCFYECTGLICIPPLLFDKNTKVTNYSYCFYNCTNLTGSTPVNSEGKKLWELTPTPIGTACFRGCTKLSDYDSIPADWK